MLAWTCLVLRGWNAIKMSGHFVIAKITGISDLGSYDLLEFL